MVEPETIPGPVHKSVAPAVVDDPFNEIFVLLQFSVDGKVIFAVGNV